ncbi:hypothetical protein [Streptoalloteichus hindustanus]|uniref:Uncharacterized protein n=1 Tax=Streptoalloteichus hindustanus TaxID=2017 RepID=A0A1M5LD97_STRHI|nr:hypothetical protein [Streptoalloteichus hindustanus]SHG62679.1 hypothetical protein SAMN05444320_11162 [Streptoalloteichus hindustanus]
MSVDSTPQPCPHCLRPTVLVSHGWGREWVHLGTWRRQCGAPVWMRAAEASAGARGERVAQPV